MVDFLSFKSSLDASILESVISVEESGNHFVMEILPSAITNVVSHLKSKKGYSFSTLIDITAIDFPEKEKRFELVYHFLLQIQ